MFWLLKFLQRIARFRRRILGDPTPHWFKDGAAAVSYVNVIDLLPTLIAISLAPRHFYERLPQYSRNKRTWFKTPVKFFTSSITLIAGLIIFLIPEELKYYNISDKSIYWTLAGMLLAVPIMVPFLCLIIRFILAGLPNFNTPPILATNLLIPMSPWTYIRLDPRHFLWAALYFGVYFYIAMQVLEIIALYGSQLFSWLLSDMHDCLSTLRRLDPQSTISNEARQAYLSTCYRGQHNPNMSAQYLTMLSLGLLALVASLLLINPYLWVLRASAKIPTSRMHRGDALEVADAIKSFLSLGAKDARKSDWPRVLRRLSVLDRSVAVLERKKEAQNRRVITSNAKLLDVLQRERRQAYTKIILVAGLRAMLQTPGLPEDVQRRIESVILKLERLAGPLTARAIPKPAESRGRTGAFGEIVGGRGCNAQSRAARMRAVLPVPAASIRSDAVRRRSASGRRRLAGVDTDHGPGHFRNARSRDAHAKPVDRRMCAGAHHACSLRAHVVGRPRTRRPRCSSPSTAPRARSMPIPRCRCSG